MLLCAACGIYLLLGDVHEALVLGALVVLNVGITVVQERKSERALEALRDLSSPRALVLRDGAPLRIAGADVVRGDLLLLAEGDRVPADGRLVEVNDLLVDESLLTGESLPVDKRGGQAGVFRHHGGEGAGARGGARDRVADRVRAHRARARKRRNRGHAAAGRDGAPREGDHRVRDRAVGARHRALRLSRGATGWAACWPA